MATRFNFELIRAQAVRDFHLKNYCHAPHNIQDVITQTLNRYENVVPCTYQPVQATTPNPYRLATPITVELELTKALALTKIATLVSTHYLQAPPAAPPPKRTKISTPALSKPPVIKIEPDTDPDTESTASIVAIESITPRREPTLTPTNARLALLTATKIYLRDYVEYIYQMLKKHYHEPEKLTYRKFKEEFDKLKTFSHEDYTTFKNGIQAHADNFIAPSVLGDGACYYYALQYLLFGDQFPKDDEGRGYTKLSKEKAFELRNKVIDHLPIYNILQVDPVSNTIEEDHYEEYTDMLGEQKFIMSTVHIDVNQYLEAQRKEGAFANGYAISASKILFNFDSITSIIATNDIYKIDMFQILYDPETAYNIFRKITNEENKDKLLLFMHNTPGTHFTPIIARH